MGEIFRKVGVLGKSLLLVVFLVVVALLEGLYQSEDRLDLIATGLLDRILHVPLHGFEFCELENQFGQVCVE
jgi:hypothetical protein